MSGLSRRQADAAEPSGLPGCNSDAAGQLEITHERRRSALQAVKDALVELEVANRHHDAALRACLSHPQAAAAIIAAVSAGLDPVAVLSCSGLPLPKADAAGVSVQMPYRPEYLAPEQD